MCVCVYVCLFVCGFIILCDYSFNYLIHLFVNLFNLEFISILLHTWWHMLRSIDISLLLWSIPTYSLPCSFYIYTIARTHNPALQYARVYRSRPACGVMVYRTYGTGYGSMYGTVAEGYVRIVRTEDFSIRYWVWKSRYGKWECAYVDIFIGCCFWFVFFGCFGCLVWFDFLEQERNSWRLHHTPENFFIIIITY